MLYGGFAAAANVSMGFTYTTDSNGIGTYTDVSAFKHPLYNFGRTAPLHGLLTM
jgi:hypothetical protein